MTVIGPPPKAWQERWDASPFTWSSLEHRMVLPDGKTSLLDYWCWDPQSATLRSADDLRTANEIEMHGGVEYHLAHVPTHINGVATWKADTTDKKWDKLQSLIDARLQAKETNPPPGGIAASGAILLHLDGCILLSLPSPIDADQSTIICAQTALFVDKVEYKGQRIGKESSFQSAVFCAFVDFEAATFCGDIDFLSTAFVGGASFRLAEFKGTAEFSSTAFDDETIFTGAKFRGAAQFDGGKFVNEVRFNRVMFKKDVSFDGADLSVASFRHARFCADHGLGDVTLGSKTRFDGAHFAFAHRIGFWAGAIWWLVFVVGLFWAYRGYRAHDPLSVPAVFAYAFGIFLLLWSILGAFAFRRPAAIAADVEVFRKLKEHFEQQKITRSYHLFQGLELKLTRMQLGRSFWTTVLSKPVERGLSVSYEALSNYGNSIGRPLAFLIISLGLFSCLYWSWHDRGAAFDYTVNGIRTWSIDPKLGFDPNFIDATTFATSRIVPWNVNPDPPANVHIAIDTTASTTRDEAEKVGPEISEGASPAHDEKDSSNDCSLAKELLAVGNSPDGEECGPSWIGPDETQRLALHRFAIRTCLTVQTLFTTLLIFFIALGAKRRFQPE